MDYKTALQCAMLSEDVYQAFSDNITFREWPNVTPVLIDSGDTDTQLAILDDPSKNVAAIVFQGSQSGRDWATNFQLKQREYEWSRTEKRAYSKQMKQMAKSVTNNEDLVYPAPYSQPSTPVKMHKGFVKAYLSVRDRIHDHVQNSSITRYRMTGHSLGAALAKICALDLQYNFSHKISVETYSFGCPRVGNKAFVESYNRRVSNTWRVVYGWDAVVGLPTLWQGYRHVATPLRLSRGFTWRIITGSFQDHRIDKYIDALATKAMTS